MTEQLSLFETEPQQELTAPLTLEEVCLLWQNHIWEHDNDEDAFTWAETTSGYSFSFYGRKVLEMKNKAKGTTLAVRGRLKQALIPSFFVDEEKQENFFALPKLDHQQMSLLVQLLIAEKEAAFRDTATESFACCNDFIRCSDAKACIHPKDRFFIKCAYRQNLEQGRIFYGKNANVAKEA